MQEKGIISTNQYIWLLFGLITSFTTLQIPGMLIAHTGKDAWLSVAVAWFVDILFAVVYAYLGILYPKQNIIEYSITIFGNYIGRMIGAFFLIFFLFVASNLIRDLCTLIGNLFLPKTPINVLITLSFILIAFGAKKGIEVLARTDEILGPVYLLSFIILFALAFPAANFSNLRPQLYAGALPFITGAPLLDSFMGICVLMGMYIPYCNKPENGFIGKFIAATIGASTFGLLIILSTCIFGSEQVGNMINPGLQLARFVSFGSFIQRMEAVWLMISVAAGIMAAANLIWAFSLGLSQIVGISSYKSLVYPSSLIALFICIAFFDNSIELFTFSFYVYPFIELFIVTGLGTILLVGAIISKKKKTDKSSQ